MSEMADSKNTLQPKPIVSEPAEVEVWLTHADQSKLFQRQSETIRFDYSPQQNLIIQINTDKTYQPMEGFGFALTGGSADLINQLPLIERNDLLVELFSPENNGIGVSFLRLTIGASDLSALPFSYADMPVGQEDNDLSGFNLFAGDIEVIPLLKDILAINPDISLIASPWSAPTWMKTNQSWIGGALSLDCYSVYADYLVKYLQMMNSHGISIRAITIQNEPLNPKNEPSMVMSAEEQAAFIKDHLGPALRAAGLEGVELFCWDHNCDKPEYPLTVLADPKAREFISGVAWHLYGGDISALSKVHQAYPDKKLYFTEQWVGRDGHFAGDLSWHIKNVLVGACRNWSRVVLEWNLASDPECGPHTQGGEPNCVGALTIGAEITRNVAYYIIAHAAKFVRPGSMRIFSSLSEALPNVAFKTPDNRIILIVLNESLERLRFNIEYQGRQAMAELRGGSVATYVWPV